MNVSQGTEGDEFFIIEVGKVSITDKWARRSLDLWGVF
jgi:hypothetical protein